MIATLLGMSTHGDLVYRLLPTAFGFPYAVVAPSGRVILAYWDNDPCISPAPHACPTFCPLDRED